MRLKKIFSWFERRLNPYPDWGNAAVPANKFIPFLWFSLYGVKKWLLILMILGIIIGVFEAFLLQMMGRVVDFLNQDTPATLWIKHGKVLVFFAVVILLSPLWTFFKSSVQYQTLTGVFPMRIRWWLHHLMLNQSMRFFQDEFAGRVAAKVMQTALAVRQVILTVADMAVYIVIYLITSLVILFSFDWRLAVPILLWLAALALVMKLLVPKIALITQRQADARSLMTGRITDTYANMQTVKLFSRNANESAYAREAMDEFLVTVHGQMRLVTVLDVALYSINILLILAVAALGIFLWSRQVISVGAVAAATALSLRLNNMAFWIIMEMAMLFENIGIVRDGMQTFSVLPEINDAPGALPLAVNKGEIRFQRIAFSYIPAKPLFRDFTLTVRAGEKLGLVGRSGSGKSTLINLLLRFYELNSGKILIDGQNISTVTQESLRSAIGMVTQDTSLLHRSIRDNIRYGAGTVEEAAMIKAATAAEAHEFIAQLSDKYGNEGYDTLVGERGVKLSGGQRQRIAIARVLLKNSPILVLDEATSALDSEVEAAIQDTLGQLMSNKTVIAVAHRLSTIAAMDRLVVVDAGQIKESGTHQQLLALGGIYAQLWARQSGGFLPED